MASGERSRAPPLTAEVTRGELSGYVTGAAMAGDTVVIAASDNSGV